MITNYIYILSISEFILLIIALYITKVDYTSPSVITLSMFFLSTLCVVWNIDNWDVYISSKTNMIVISVLSLILIVEFFIQSIFKNKKRWLDHEEIKDDRFQIYPIVVIMLSLLSVIFMIIFVREVSHLGGGGLSAISTVKLDDNLKISRLAKIALRVIRVMPYPCVFIIAHNVILHNQKIRNNALLLIPVVMACIVIFFSGSRGPYLYILLSLYVYIVMFERYKNGWRDINIKKYIKPIIITIIVFIAIFVGTRSIVKGHEFSSSTIEYFTFYFGSPIHLLNKIIDNTSIVFPKKYSYAGMNTFVAFYEELYKFGIINESIDINQTKFVAVGGNFIGGGNVFTFIASPLNDFGIWGLYIYVIIFYGIICGFYYKKIKNCVYIHKNYISLLLYGYFFYLVFMTFYVTTTVYLKGQTILEIIIMIIIYKALTSLRIVMKK